MKRHMTLDTLLRKGKQSEETKESKNSSKDLRWSPNNIKTVIISEKQAVIEHFTVEGSANGNWFETATFDEVGVDPLKDKSVLTPIFSDTSSIKYSSLEEIIFLCTPAYNSKGLFKMDYADYYTQLANEIKGRTEKKILLNFPRLYAVYAIACDTGEVVGSILNNIKQNARSTGYAHHYDRLFDEVKGKFKYVLEIEGGKPQDERSWWRNGIILPSETTVNNNPLRGWLYALDANPDSNETNSNSMPIYKAFERVAEKYKSILLKKLEDEKASAIKSKELEKGRKVASSELVTARKEALNIAPQYIDCYDTIATAIRLNRQYCSLQLMACAVSRETLTDDTDVKDGEYAGIPTGVIACALYTQDKRHTNPTKKGYIAMLAELNTYNNYLATVFDGISSDIFNVLKLWNLGLYAYMRSTVIVKTMNTALSDPNRELDIRDLAIANASPELVALSKKSIASLYSCVENSNSELALLSKEVVHSEFPDSLLNRATSLIDILLKAELISAYYSFIKFLPLWAFSNKVLELASAVYAKEAGFDIHTDPYFIIYDDKMLDILRSLCASMQHNWEEQLRLFPCAKHSETNVNFTPAEYRRRIKGVYASLTYMIKSGIMN